MPPIFTVIKILLEELDGVMDADNPVTVAPVAVNEPPEAVTVVVVENAVVNVVLTTCNTAPAPSLDVLIAADAEMPELSIVDTAIIFSPALQSERLVR